MAAREWMPILFLLLKAPCYARMVGFKFVVGFVGFLKSPFVGLENP